MGKRAFSEPSQCLPQCGPIWGTLCFDGGGAGTVQGLSPGSLPGGGDEDSGLGWVEHEESKLKVVVGSMGSSGCPRREKEQDWAPVPSGSLS